MQIHPRHKRQLAFRGTQPKPRASLSLVLNPTSGYNLSTKTRPYSESDPLSDNTNVYSLYYLSEPYTTNKRDYKRN